MMFEGETILPIAELFGGCSTLRAISGGHTGPQCDARCAKGWKSAWWVGVDSCQSVVFLFSPGVPRSSIPTFILRLHVSKNEKKP